MIDRVRVVGCAAVLGALRRGVGGVAQARTVSYKNVVSSSGLISWYAVQRSSRIERPAPHVKRLWKRPGIRCGMRRGGLTCPNRDHCHGLRLAKGKVGRL